MGEAEYSYFFAVISMIFTSWICAGADLDSRRNIVDASRDAGTIDNRIHFTVFFIVPPDGANYSDWISRSFIPFRRKMQKSDYDWLPIRCEAREKTVTHFLQKILEYSAATPGLMFREVKFLAFLRPRESTNPL